MPQVTGPGPSTIGSDRTHKSRSGKFRRRLPGFGNRHSLRNHLKIYGQAEHTVLENHPDERMDGIPLERRRMLAAEMLLRSERPMEISRRTGLSLPTLRN
jgi:hypothetical protein